MLICPVCGASLKAADNGLVCPAGHRFDRAREGYFNLLRSNKKGDSMGDPKEQARSRRDFLDRGYYAPLRDALVELVSERVQEREGESAGGADVGLAGGFAGTEGGALDGSNGFAGAETPRSVVVEQAATCTGVSTSTGCSEGKAPGERPAPAGGAAPLTLLDICCGEGYYTSAMGSVPGVAAYGFDLGKEMVRLAAKRGGATYFVANLKAIPAPAGSVDIATHLFAPFNEREFSRVLAPEGVLYTVVPGARHLFGLKEVLYETPYLNDEKLPACESLQLVGTQRVSATIELACQDDIEAVFRMTPYYFRTPRAGREKLRELDRLETDIEFIIAAYRHTR